MTWFKRNEHIFSLFILILTVLYSITVNGGVHATPSPKHAHKKIDVYVAGSTNHDKYNYIPAYWKNGIPVYLTDGNRQGKATGIVVIGNDVYVSGDVEGKGHTIATYWKNGVAVSLTDGKNKASATGIAVVGKDIYVSG